MPSHFTTSSPRRIVRVALTVAAVLVVVALGYAWVAAAMGAPGIVVPAAVAAPDPVRAHLTCWEVQP